MRCSFCFGWDCVQFMNVGRWPSFFLFWVPVRSSCKKCKDLQDLVASIAHGMIYDQVDILVERRRWRWPHVRTMGGSAPSIASRKKSVKLQRWTSKQVHRPCREHSRTISYREDEARGARGADPWFRGHHLIHFNSPISLRIAQYHMLCPPYGPQSMIRCSTFSSCV